MTMKLPRSVELFEVGPRDGLQNETKILSKQVKLQYIKKLILSGVRNIEIGAFVREDRILQMADTDELFRLLHRKLSRDFSESKSASSLTLWALVPNERGLERALAAGCKAIAVFTGATNSFTKNNIGMTVGQSLKVFAPIIRTARKEKLRVRGYVSVCWGCPYEGHVKKSSVVKLTRSLLDLGVEQVSLGDTIGVATPTDVIHLLGELKTEIKKNQIAGHFHDTRGTALANCFAALQMGVQTLDSSSGGLGGCNYAPGATGNVASEDLLYMLEGMGVKTAVNLEKLCQASHFVNQALHRKPTSRYLQAWLSEQK